MRLPLAFLLVFSLCMVGCNLFGTLDPPGEVQDRFAAAVSLANEGRCEEARDMLLGIANPSDDIKVALGWTQLCIGSATAANIAISIYKFSSNSNDLTVVGALGRLLLPMNGTKMNSINDAVTTFNSVSDTNRRNIQLGIANTALSAAILANQAVNSGAGSLERTDISAASCANNSANCIIGCAAGMPDGDVTSFTNAMAAAAAALSSTSAGELRALSAAINSGLAGGTAAARCFIFNNTVPNP